MITLKLFASLLLLMCLVVGVRRADKKFHNPNYHTIAEYMTGFIFAFGALWGLYALWC